VFITEEQPHQMLSEGDITDESVLNAIAEQDASRRHNLEMK